MQHCPASLSIVSVQHIDRNTRLAITQRGVCRVLGAPAVSRRGATASAGAHRRAAGGALATSAAAGPAGQQKGG